MAGSDQRGDFGMFRGEWLQAVARDADLPHGAAAVAIFLAHHYADATTRSCWPSVATLAKDLGQKTRKRAQVAITALCKAGYLQKKQGGGRASGSTKDEPRGASNFYTLTMPHDRSGTEAEGRLTVPDMEHSTALTVPGTEQSDAVNCPRNRLLTVPDRGHEPSYRTLPKNKGDTPLPPKVAKRAAVSRKQAASADDLRRFIEVYPASRHRAPDAAVGKALAAAMRTASIEEILSGAGRYAAERASEDPQYTKAATNWLRGRGWETTGLPPALRRQDGMRGAMQAAAEAAMQSAVTFDDEGEEVGNGW